MHATPHFVCSGFLRNSDLLNPNGFVGVDINTLQHKKYDNIFAAGDCADLPISKTLSAVNEQVHILSENLISKIKGYPLQSKYDGYTGCPVLVGKRKVMLCEFGYQDKLMPTFSPDQRKPTHFFYFLKKFVFDKFALYSQCSHIRLLRKTFARFNKNIIEE